MTILKLKMQNCAFTHVKMNAFGRTQWQQSAKLPNHTWLPLSSCNLAIANWRNMCLKLASSNCTNNITKSYKQIMANPKHLIHIKCNLSVCVSVLCSLCTATFFSGSRPNLAYIWYPYIPGMVNWSCGVGVPQNWAIHGQGATGDEEWAGATLNDSARL